MRYEKFNGDQLKEALQLRAKKITELAEETGISKQSLSLYANGINIPPAENVFKIANALNFPYRFFMAESLQSIETGKTYFRSQASATKRARVAAAKKTQYAAALYKILLEKIDFPKLNLPEINSIYALGDLQDCDSDESVFRIETLADELRKYWGLDDGPIDGLQYLLESNGIIVTGFKDEEFHIDAYSQQVDVNGEKVFIVALELGKKPLVRLRFDMAHELGHILMHSWEVDDDVSKDEFNAREKQANIFASALLLPRKRFTKDVSVYPTSLDYYRELKNKWKVSIQAMMYRARQLELISTNQFQYMMRQVSRKGWRLKEPGDVPGKLNDNVFQGAIDLLLHGNYMSKSEIMEEFERKGIFLRYNDLENLMCLRKGTLAPEPKQDKHLKLCIKGTFGKE